MYLDILQAVTLTIGLVWRWIHKRFPRPEVNKDKVKIIKV